MLENYQQESLVNLLESPVGESRLGIRKCEHLYHHRADLYFLPFSYNLRGNIHQKTKSGYRQYQRNQSQNVTVHSIVVLYGNYE